MRKEDKFILNDTVSINYDEIVHIQSKDNGTVIILFDKTIHKSILSIDKLEWELPKDIFVRVHPNHIINKEFLNKYFTVTSQWVQLQNGEKIPVSRKLVQDNSENIFRKIIKKIFFFKNSFKLK